jgi:hypothetical protein
MFTYRFRTSAYPTVPAQRMCQLYCHPWPPWAICPGPTVSHSQYTTHGQQAHCQPWPMNSAPSQLSAIATMHGQNINPYRAYHQPWLMSSSSSQQSAMVKTHIVFGGGEARRDCHRLAHELCAWPTANHHHRRSVHDSARDAPSAMAHA